MVTALLLLLPAAGIDAMECRFLFLSIFLATKAEGVVWSLSSTCGSTPCLCFIWRRYRLRTIKLLSQISHENCWPLVGPFLPPLPPPAAGLADVGVFISQPLVIGGVLGIDKVNFGTDFIFCLVVSLLS